MSQIILKYFLDTRANMLPHSLSIAHRCSQNIPPQTALSSARLLHPPHYCCCVCSASYRIRSYGVAPRLVLSLLRFCCPRRCALVAPPPCFLCPCPCPLLEAFLLAVPRRSLLLCVVLGPFRHCLASARFAGHRVSEHAAGEFAWKQDWER